MPLHSKSREFAKSGLFAGLRSFEELEKRIAKIPANKEKGDAFEVFAEAYLVTQRRHEIREAWPLDAVSLDLLRKLKLPLKDYGVDGVTLTMLGGHQVYQVKFRSGRTPLTWEELSTFMGLSDSPEIQSKVVITNCDELPAVINERHNFFCIRGSDLDRLTPEDFKVIAAWVSESVLTINKSKPFPHQQEALDALLPALKVEDRVSAIMACGTGKTLTALWTTEQLGASKVLVLLPSLALLRQTLHEWLKETSLNLAYLCVCSDPSVKDDADAISTAQSDLDFEVSTDSSTVRQFLDAPFKGTKVIFSTSGREGRNYGYALEDKNIAIRKRLVVTATPRHYNPSKRNKEGEATVAFSMDEPKVYGPQSYVLSFGEAARRKIICGYKVIISVITSEQVGEFEEVNDEVLSKGTVSVKGDAIRARQVANQIALRDAVAQYGVSKIFTFHSTVKSAASFTSDGSEGVSTHLSDFRGLHVSGAMPTARRERVMKEFRSAPRAVMSNARCLTEGVDVPAVDMVAFLSPKKSKVDIVQAIGRAMRKSIGKETGYILIPLYLEQKSGESIDEAVARANFEEVWDILQSLQEQDEVLAELIREMAVAKGHGRIRGKGFDDSRFTDRIDFTGPVLVLESIRQAITTKVLERLESSWDVNFGKLVKFKEEHGHSRIARDYSSDPQLGIWVQSQRNNYSKRILSANRIARLEAIDFEWDPLSSDWERNFVMLFSYRSEHGDCRVPQLYKPNPQLAIWVSVQRNNYYKGILSANRITRLEAIDFDWDPLSSDWERNFTMLASYKAEHGDCLVPYKYELNPQLGIWVRGQRNNYSKGKLSADRIARLKALGFVWDALAAWWELSFSKLLFFKDNTGNCRVPARYEADPELSGWVSDQRKLYSKGKLSSHRIERLESLGFEWDPFATTWDLNFSKLKRFKSQFGHCHVPRQYKADSQLAGWVEIQRFLYSKGRLSHDRILKLEILGFEWDPIGTAWELQLSKLSTFKSRNGHCRVPQQHKAFPQLGKWASHQRGFYSKGTLSAERIAKLEALGFEWDPLSSDWESNFAMLKSYKSEHGNCRVPRGYTPNPRLSIWVTHQRNNFSKGKLSPDRIARLDALGFEWKVR
ncbi:MAG: Helicase associated domain protein [Verrucomicrobia bacterium]|nr:Helicase associated domain protein [Verrucomicrobiota bacterium]